MIKNGTFPFEIHEIWGSIYIIVCPIYFFIFKGNCLYAMLNDVNATLTQKKNDACIMSVNKTIVRFQNFATTLSAKIQDTWRKRVVYDKFHDGAVRSNFHQ